MESVNNREHVGELESEFRKEATSVDTKSVLSEEGVGSRKKSVTKSFGRFL